MVIEVERSPLPAPVIRLADWHHLRWHKDTRYYEAILEQDLWGEWIFVRRWGRRGFRSGRSQSVLCDSYEQGLRLLRDVIERRTKRGYVAVTDVPEVGELIAQIRLV